MGLKRAIFYKFEVKKQAKLIEKATFCKLEYSGVGTWEAANSLCSKSLQSLKVSNIWALPIMALPCNGYKLNLLTSASMCHMALCSLCWKLHSNFSFHWKNELKQAFSTCCSIFQIELHLLRVSNSFHFKLFFKFRLQYSIWMLGG